MSSHGIYASELTLQTSVHAYIAHMNTEYTKELKKLNACKDLSFGNSHNMRYEYSII